MLKPLKLRPIANNTWYALGLLVLALNLWLYIAQWEAPTSLRKGDAMPPLRLTGLDGKPVAQTPDRPTMRYFLTPNNPYAIAELPILATWARTHPEITIVLILVGADVPTARTWAAQHAEPFLLLLDLDGSTAAAHFVTQYPSVIGVDATGRLRFVRVGGPLTLTQMDTYSVAAFAASADQAVLP